MNIKQLWFGEVYQTIKRKRTVIMSKNVVYLCIV